MGKFLFLERLSLASRMGKRSLRVESRTEFLILTSLTTPETHYYYSSAKAVCSSVVSTLVPTRVSQWRLTFLWGLFWPRAESNGQPEFHTLCAVWTKVDIDNA